MEVVLSALSVILMSALKFFFAAPLSYSLGFDFIATLCLQVIGGSLGMACFYFLGAWLMEWFRRRHLRRVEKRLARGLPPPRVFTRTNRFIVRIKHSYGLRALLVMPPILSIPITAIIAAKYFRHDRRTLPALVAAVAVWALLFSSAWIFLQ